MIATLLLAFTSFALAFTPREGSQLWFFATDGSTLLGFGQVVDGRLDLALSSTMGDFALLLVHPDGGVEVRSGFLEGSERLWVLLDDGEPVNLDELIEAVGIDVELHVDASVASLYGPEVPVSAPPGEAEVPAVPTAPVPGDLPETPIDDDDVPEIAETDAETDGDEAGDELDGDDATPIDPGGEPAGDDDPEDDAGDPR